MAFPWGLSSMYLRAYCASALTSFSSGIVVQRAGLPQALLEALLLLSPTSTSFDFSTWPDPVVLLVVGQCNAANHGRPRGRAGSGS